MMKAATHATLGALLVSGGLMLLPVSPAEGFFHSFLDLGLVNEESSNPNATPSPSPTSNEPDAVPVTLGIQAAPLPSPTPTPSPYPAVPALSSRVAVPVLKIFVTVKSPNGGETIALAKGKSAITNIQFGYGGTFDSAKSGNYKFAVELWKDGVRLGGTSNFDHYFLNINETSAVYGHTPGEYWVVNPVGIKEIRKAVPGSGYQFRVVLLEAVTPPGEVTTYPDLASDFSDGTFTYTSPEPSVPDALARFEKIFVRVKSPNGGETIALTKDATTGIQFDYGGSFNPETSGNYRYRLELWQNGKRLGDLSNFDHYFLNINETSAVYGHTPGEYWVVNPVGIKEIRKAVQGSGYQFRVVLLRAVTPPGEVTRYDELANDVTDGSFSYTDSTARSGGWVARLTRVILSPVRALVQRIRGLF